MEAPFHKWAKRIDPEKAHPHRFILACSYRMVAEFAPHYTDFGGIGCPIDKSTAALYYTDAGYCIDRLLFNEPKE